MRKAKYGIAITTYEIDEGESTPVLTHIFWGNTFKEAMAVSKAHLKTDEFYRSSYTGKMKWYDGVLYLENEAEIIGTTQHDPQKVLEYFEQIVNK